MLYMSDANGLFGSQSCLLGLHSLYWYIICGFDTEFGRRQNEHGTQDGTCSNYDNMHRDMY